MRKFAAALTKKEVAMLSLFNMVAQLCRLVVSTMMFSAV
jgi:hypothetical protein